MATEIWRQIAAELAALEEDLPWDQGMTAFATITRRSLLSHRDGATMVSGTYLTDPAVLRGLEAGLASLARQGFAVADVVRAYQLLYSFTIGFCIEEQAVAQAGDDRYSLSRRAERVGATTHPLAAEAGPVIFGDQDTRFAELVAILVDAAGRLRSAAGGASGRERRTRSAGAERKDDQPRSETPPEPVNRVEVQSPGRP
jgi:hypothetical protein